MPALGVWKSEAKMRVFSSGAHRHLMVTFYRAVADRAVPQGNRSRRRGVQDYSSWGFEEGDEIVAGRHATRLLGGGRRYEAYLSWDDELRALVVVKIVRPALLDNASVLHGIEGEARALRALAHPTIVRMFDAVLEGGRSPVQEVGGGGDAAYVGMPAGRIWCSLAFGHCAGVAGERDLKKAPAGSRSKPE